jgi:hypothetical protein
MREDLRCPPERMVAVLEHLDTQWGGVEGYLETAGVSSTEIATLRSKLTN